jgi:hypothetical protein
LSFIENQLPPGFTFKMPADLPSKMSVPVGLAAGVEFELLELLEDVSLPLAAEGALELGHTHGAWGAMHPAIAVDMSATPRSIASGVFIGSWVIGLLSLGYRRRRAPAVDAEVGLPGTAKNLKRRMSNLHALSSQSRQGKCAHPSFVEARDAPYTYPLSIRNKAIVTRKKRSKISIFTVYFSCASVNFGF